MNIFSLQYRSRWKTGDGIVCYAEDIIYYKRRLDLDNCDLEQI